MKVRVIKREGYIGDKFIVQYFNGLWITAEEFSTIENAMKYIEHGVLDMDDETVWEC